MKVYHQTLFSPVISALTFLLIFVFSVGGHLEKINGIDYGVFMGIGLIVMSMMQQSYANVTSSMIISKINGSIVDNFLPPISNLTFMSAYVAASVIRGLLVGVLTYACLAIFIDISIYNLPLLAIYVVFANLILAQLGFITGIYASSFDQMSAVTTYVVTPLSFLSGTFYSIKTLPVFLQKLNLLNPFFYVIDGFRYSLTGVLDSDIQISLIFLTSVTIILFIIIYCLLKTGYKLKS